MSTAMQVATRRILVGVGFLFGFLLIGQPALAGIVGSKHDLTTATGSGNYTTSGTAEVCVFCHTPHGGSQVAPLWNRGSAGGSFQTYTSDTLDSPLADTGVTGSISAACLSCHDGATALDMLINAPGSGGYTAGGASQAWTFTGGSNTITAGITDITTDLRDDHPISIPYCGGVTANNVCKDPDFFLTNFQHNSGGTVDQNYLLNTGLATDQYWIDTVTLNGVREKTDVLLYTRAFNAGANEWPSVECASCHEPHNGGAAGTPFLRIANDASALCTTCHNK